MHKLTPIAMLFAAASAHSSVDLYAGKGSGKILSSHATYEECVKAGAKTRKQYTCKTTVVPPAPAPAPTPAPAPVPAPPPPAPPPPAPPVVLPTDGYVNCADEGGTCVVREPGHVIYGAGLLFSAPMVVVTDTPCTNAVFGDPASGVVKACWYRLLPPSTDPIPPVMDFSGPAFDPAKIPTASFSAGTNELRVQPTTEIAPGSADGAFRTSCLPIGMRKDDPIVFPGQPGRSHLHTFFGNTGVNASSTEESIRNTGNSSCRGGIANRSAYWVSTMIDTETGTPIAPRDIGVYYKNGFFPGNQITQGVPEGLRMIAGNPNAKAPRGQWDEFSYRWKCVGGPNNQNAHYGSDIPPCDPGAEVWQEIMFPQCWDGKNLDSPDHKSHMNFGETYLAPPTPTKPDGEWKYRCPSTHAVILPSVSFNVIYITPAKGTLKWRLSSDAYDPLKPGGWSSHGDWYNGWRKSESDAWANGCIKGMKDCHSHLLGDGRELY